MSRKKDEPEIVIATPVIAVKAGDKANEVLILVPYGGPFGNGVDAVEDYFDNRTDFSVPGMPDVPRPIFYGHGSALGNKPEVIGTAVSYEDKPEGRWYKAVLDMNNSAARDSLVALSKGTLKSSSDAIPALYDRVKDAVGYHVRKWAIVGISLIDEGKEKLKAINPYAIVTPSFAKAALAEVGLDLDTGGGDPERKQGDQPKKENAETKPSLKGINMDEKELSELIDKRAKDMAEEAARTALKAQREADAADALKAKEAKEATDAQVKEAVDAALKARDEADAAKNRRLPGGGAPYVAEFADTQKFDNLTPGELGLAIDIMRSRNLIPSDGAYKALAIKLIQDKEDYGQRELAPIYSHSAMKASGLPLEVDAYKAATDPMYTGGTTDGGNWVHTSYGRDIWGTIRAESKIVAMVPGQVIPDGFKSATIPLEGVDLTWYSAPEASASDATLLVPAATVAASQITTPTNKEITVAKMGARGLYSGEQTEDSIVAFVPQLREQLVTSGKEQLEHAVIDGDTATSATTNINHIGGTPTSTGLARDLFLMFDGFRKLALVTNTANSRPGGAITEDDYLETMWLMGTAGLAGADLSKCAFIIDPNVYKKSLQMAAVKTKDVWSNATLESGVLTKLWGYNVFPSWFTHFKSSVRLANSAGKVDQTTPGNNLYGSILGVRWDQWKFAYKRQMTIETTRIANADAYEIVAWARVGLGYRDTEASAVSYGLSV